jgi:hypothetical protein
MHFTYPYRLSWSFTFLNPFDERLTLLVYAHFLHGGWFHLELCLEFSLRSRHRTVLLEGRSWICDWLHFSQQFQLLVIHFHLVTCHSKDKVFPHLVLVNSCHCCLCFSINNVKVQFSVQTPPWAIMLILQVNIWIGPIGDNHFSGYRRSSDKY